MNLILEHTGQVPYFTEMASVFRALKISASDYDWYISDIETNYDVPGLSAENQWLTGAALHRLVTEQEIQFIWAVFSAVPRGVRPAFTNPPCANGNCSYWTDAECKPQLEGALFEIACWDSSATILVGITAEMAANFYQVYSDAKLLSVSH
ncbi:MAG: hypothetical protein U5L74_06785 [Ideonella sp.]|nr:hypothetical protein [Ideonella sp.]